MRYTAEGMGQAIRARRTALTPRMSQKTLGEAAGYGSGAGAGVAISRIESGQVRPRPDKLAGIATALGATVKALEREAAQHSSAGGLGPDASDSSARPRGERSLRDRLEAVRAEVEVRTTTVTELGDAFNAAHDRARGAFLLKFLEDAAQIEGGPKPPEPEGPTEDEWDDPEAVAQFRVTYASNAVASVLGDDSEPAPRAVPDAMYSKLRSAATFGSTSVWTAVANVVAANAMRTVRGGDTAPGSAVSTAFLKTAAAGPLALLVAPGLLWTNRRNKQKEAELRAKLSLAEAELEAGRPGYEASVAVVKRATELLDYIAVHASHAERRWSSQLPQGTLAWSELSEGQRERYEDFVAIAGCQLAVETIEVEAFLSTRDTELERLIEETDSLLDQARRAVEKLV